MLFDFRKKLIRPEIISISDLCNDSKKYHLVDVEKATLEKIQNILMCNKDDDLVFIITNILNKQNSRKEIIDGKLFHYYAVEKSVIFPVVKDIYEEDVCMFIENAFIKHVENK